MYCAFFALNEMPFGLTPDTQFYCPLPAHEDVLETVQIALQHGCGVIKITGDIGCGKTLLCRLLMQRFDRKQPYAYIPNPVLSPDALLHHVATEIGLSLSAEPAQRLWQIERQLLAMARFGHRTVLLIDEAQAMPPETLETVRLLSNLESEKGKLLQIVLFGQPDLDSKLQQTGARQLAQRIEFSQHLPPLPAHLCRAYLHHRLRKSGWQHASLFSHQQARVVHWLAGGVPRLCNILANKCLMLAFGQQRQRVRWRDIVAAAIDTESTRHGSAQWLLSILSLTIVARIGGWS